MSGTSSIQQQIASLAPSYGVDPALALAIANQESGFNQNARGAAGEIGVFQLMPGTAQDLGVNPYDLSQNIQGGLTYLAQLQAEFGGDISKTVEAYNAGPGAVNAGRIPASTQSYLSNILSALGVRQPSSGVPSQAPAPTPGAGSPFVTVGQSPAAITLPSLSSLEVGASGLAIAIAALALLALAG